ncbi:unnamed protein product [Brachionus calyciflorus]|uniref:Neuronal membrane glycoprotein M6-b n=1 Tax=Brachionus calyciflorus TaxID=104777 RepID=A0A813SMG4_9BILA|nr:unnamed protein product [Brachionus calyciflorus]
MKNMDDSTRFADQSKALWLQQNNSLNMNGSNDVLDDKLMFNPPSTTWMGRCPFASIIATVITLCGTGVFCGCLYRALSISIQALNSAFEIEFEMESARALQTIVIIISTVMCSLAIILLIVGCLATGATRSQIYTGFRSRLGGRISTGFFTIVVYVLFIVWSGVTVVLVVPIIAYYILMKNCEIKIAQINNHSVQKLDECLSLRNFGIHSFENKMSICSSQLIQFCNQGKEAGPLYIAAFIASALIVLGLVHYLCCLVANYAHIKDGIKLKDYEEAIKEELELRCEIAAANRKRNDL